MASGGFSLPHPSVCLASSSSSSSGSPLRGCAVPCRAALPAGRRAATDARAAPGSPRRCGLRGATCGAAAEPGSRRWAAVTLGGDWSEGGAGGQERLCPRLSPATTRPPRGSGRAGLWLPGAAPRALSPSFPLAVALLEAPDYK